MKVHFLSVALLLLAYSSQSAQETPGRGCPVITVSRIEPSSTDSMVIYKAHVQGGDSLVTPKFNWTISGGKITGGQSTAEVSVKVDAGSSITVTVEVTGFAPECENKASYFLIFEPIPIATKFDEYHDLKFKEERLRLDQFAVMIHNRPGSQGYIIVYDAKGTRKPAARARGERAKNYLVKERDLPEARIVVVHGGQRDKRSVELFIAPLGASPPTATPG